jgi:glycosyltransferase involved in cell wall biosynthesis
MADLTNYPSTCLDFFQNNKLDYLLNAKNLIKTIKKNVEEKDMYYDHIALKNNLITDSTISIVMTASNRSNQTYFTLDTISCSSIKDIQVIIVDDSDSDPLAKEKLELYPFRIDFIKIIKSAKKWHNPVVNYNIGFKYIGGSFVIIQNAEVCHVGDVCAYVKNNVIDQNYYVFDVKASSNFCNNELIYKNANITTSIYHDDSLFSQWYQSASFNRKYHFLSCMTKHTFDTVKNFSYDYTVGSAYDDDDFLLKIVAKKIIVNNVFHTDHTIGGIHLFHDLAQVTWDSNAPTNELLFNIKKNIYNTTGKYIDFIENSD